MSLTSRLGRPMLAGIFITGGIDALTDPASKTDTAEDVAPFVAEKLGLPQDTELLVKIDAAVKVGAGSMLALGKMPRLASLALAASLVSTTAAAHRFWEIDDQQQKQMQQIQFFKNLGLLGGLLISAGDTGGRPSVAYSARKSARAARKSAGAARKSAGAASGALGSTLGSATHAVTDTLGSATHTVTDTLGSALETVGDTVGNAAETVGHTVGSASDTIGTKVSRRRQPGSLRSRLRAG